MIVSPQNRTYFHRSLPEVLSSFYNASDLYEIYSRLLLPILGSPVPEKRPVKQIMVQDIMSVAADPLRSKRLIETFPPKLYSIIGKLLWTESFTLKEIEDELDCSIVNVNKSNRLREFPYLLKPEFALLAIADNDPYSYHYRPNPSKEHFNISLPPAIRFWLKEHFPKPAFFDWLPLKERQHEENVSEYNCSETAVTDLKAGADFILRGNVQKNKNGKFSKATIREIESITKGGEFFPDSEPILFKLIRHEILVDFLDGFEDGDLKKIRESSDFLKEVYASLIRLLLHDPEALIQKFIPHLKSKHSYYRNEYETTFPKQLIGFILSIPVDSWISKENLHQRFYFHDLNIPFFHIQYYKANVRKIGSYCNTSDIYPENIQELVFEPMLNGIIFHLAALGVLEIRYTLPPAHKTYKTNANSFLTPFDGLHSFRLTQLGIFAFGLKKNFEFESAPAFNKAKVILDSQRLLAYCSDPDPVTASVLKDYFQPVSPSLFRATRKSLIGQAKTNKEISEATKTFRERISVEIPENWKAFLDSLEKEETLLTPLRQFDVFQLGEDVRIKKAFNQDPILKKLIFKAEGWKIIVQRSDTKQLKNRLLELGFMINF